MKIHELLKNVRQIKGYSLRDVETQIGISYAYLSQIENGKILNPSAGHLYKLAQVYQLPFEALMKAAGYIETTEEMSNQLLGLAMSKTDNLSKEESSRVAEFVNFLRLNRKQVPQKEDKDIVAPIENVHLELKNYAKKILKEAGVEKMTPVPEKDILDYMNLKKDGGEDLTRVSEDVFKQTGSWIMSGLKKVMGILDFRDKTIYVSPEIHAKKDRFVTFHEIAHNTIPWHKELFYADDAYTLSFSADKKIEAEANTLAAHFIFGGDRFSDEASDFDFSIATAKHLADKYDASYHATLRRYVETHKKSCMLIIFKIGETQSEFLQEKTKSLEYQYLVRSESFIDKFDDITPVLIEKLDEILHFENTDELLNNSIELKDEISVKNFEDKNVEFKYESWGNYYNLFLLVFPNQKSLFKKQVVFSSAED